MHYSFMTWFDVWVCVLFFSHFFACCMQFSWVRSNLMRITTIEPVSRKRCPNKSQRSNWCSLKTNMKRKKNKTQKNTNRINYQTIIVRGGVHASQFCLQIGHCLDVSLLSCGFWCAHLTMFHCLFCGHSHCTAYSAQRRPAATWTISWNRIINSEIESETFSWKTKVIS